MIDATLPQPGAHVPLPGQLSLLEEPSGECQVSRNGTEARTRLRDWWHRNRADFSPPRIESLRKLDLQCEVARDREFWQLVRAAAEEELGPLNDRRHDWRQATPFETADDAIADEVNLMLVRVCGQESRDESPESRAREERTMPQAAARKTKAARPPRPKAEKPAVVETSTVDKPQLSDELVMIDLDRLHRSPYQTRRDPTAERLAELADSLQQNGQLSPCLVRRNPGGSGYELIGGHTRTAAGRTAGRKQMQCRVVDCDDAAARRLVLIDNATHEDLTIIEKAQALQLLVQDYTAAGKSQRQLARDIGIPQTEISNAVRLLELPEAWRERLITNGITKTQARDLLPWCDVAGVWPAIEDEWKRYRDPERFRANFANALSTVLDRVSRPMSGYHWNGQRCVDVLLKPTDDERLQLTVRKVGRDERAFNVELWQRLQAAAEQVKKDREAKQLEKAQAAGKTVRRDKRTGTLVDSKKVQAEQFNKRAYRWKIGWLQARLADALQDKPETMLALMVWFSLQGDWQTTSRRTADLSAAGGGAVKDTRGRDLQLFKRLLTLDGPKITTLIRETLKRWVSHPAEGYHTDAPPEFVEALADHLGVDIVRNWSLDREYLELLTTAQLNELASEWKLTPTVSKRGELVEWLAEAGAGKSCPKGVKGIKAVSLM